MINDARGDVLLGVWWTLAAPAGVLVVTTSRPSPVSPAGGATGWSPADDRSSSPRHDRRDRVDARVRGPPVRPVPAPHARPSRRSPTSPRPTPGPCSHWSAKAAAASRYWPPRCSACCPPTPTSPDSAWLGDRRRPRPAHRAGTGPVPRQVRGRRIALVPQSATPRSRPPAPRAPSSRRPCVLELRAHTDHRRAADACRQAGLHPAPWTSTRTSSPAAWRNAWSSRWRLPDDQTSSSPTNPPADWTARWPTAPWPSSAASPTPAGRPHDHP